MKPFQHQQNPARTASEWFALIRSGEVDARADEEWKEWVDADPGHSKEYEDRELAWEMAADLGESPTIQALLNETDQQLRTSRRRGLAPTSWRLQSWQTLAAAASLVAVGVLALFWYNRGSTTVNEYATAIGEQRAITLADQSIMTLNTATKVRVLYSRATRRVELLQGEALFAVSKDPSRPFEVHALQGVSTAVGTQFDVRVDERGAAVSVLEGTVIVASDESPKSAGVSVSAGQGVVYPVGGPVSPPQPADSVRINAWVSHRIVFSDIELADALREYNRYISVPIVLGDPHLGSRHINGVFRIGDQEAFLGALRQGLHLQVTKSDAQIVLTPR